MSLGSGEVGVEGSFAGNFGIFPAHRDDRNAGVIRGFADGFEEIGGGVGVGLEENDVGVGGHGVGRIQRREIPRRPRFRAWVCRGERYAAVLIQDGERRFAGAVELRQAEIGAEGVGVGDDVRVAVGIDDGDGLCGPGAGGAVEGDLIHAIRLANLAGIEGSGQAVGGGAEADAEIDDCRRAHGLDARRRLLRKRIGDVCAEQGCAIQGFQCWV